MLNEILGPPKYTRDLYSGNDQAGVVTGLAWTAAGGEILLLRQVSAGGTGKLTLTGNLGEVMKESAVIALEYLKSNAELLDLPDNFSENGTSTFMSRKVPFQRMDHPLVLQWRLP